MKICLDLHDFSIVNNRLDFLLKLKEQFPKFKVSLFTVPIDRKDCWGLYTIRHKLLKEVKKHLDWIQIIPHGVHHTYNEMKYIDYKTFKYETLLKIEEAFVEDGLPYERGFCAPYWRWNEDIVKVLNDEGWWGAVDPRQPNMPTPKKFYRYSYCIDEVFPIYNGMKLHGHIYGTKNDLGRCIDNLFGLITHDIEWGFVTDFIEEKSVH